MRQKILLAIIILILLIGICIAILEIFAPELTPTFTLPTLMRPNVTSNQTTSNQTANLEIHGTILAENVSKYIFDNDNIYYLSNSKLYKLSKDLNTTGELASGIDSDVKNFAVDSEYIYFTHIVSGSVKLAGVQKSGGALENLPPCTSVLAKVFVSDNYIYFLPDSGTFCRSSRLGMVSDANFRSIVSSSGQNIVFDSTYVYYPDSSWIKKVPKIKICQEPLLTTTTTTTTAAPQVIGPQYGNISNNTGGNIILVASWSIPASLSASANLSMAFVETNETGEMQNKTSCNPFPPTPHCVAVTFAEDVERFELYSGDFGWANFSWTNNSISGVYVAWRMHANNTLNYWNVTPIDIFLVPVN